MIPNFDNPQLSTKLSNVLAPKPLEISNSKATYNIFKEKFQVHAELNGILRLDQLSQKTFLFQYLDDQLIQRIQVQFSRHSQYSLYDQNPGVMSIFGFLDELFEASDPLIIRRNSYFSCRQGKHEKNLEFFERLQRLELEAEVGNIHPREIFTTLLLIGLHDERLKKEITKLGTNPDMDDIKLLFVQDDNIANLSNISNPNVHEMEGAAASLDLLSNYRRNVNMRLNGPPRGRPTRPGRGASHANRGTRQPQPPTQSSSGQSNACSFKNQDGNKCGFKPYWNCFNHSRITMSRRKELDKSYNNSSETNSMSVFTVANANDPVWQDQYSQINMMDDEEILEIPMAIQELSNGRELPMNFWYPQNPSTCPRIYTRVAPAIDGQPLKWVTLVTLPDTGAQSSVINAQIVQDNGWPIIPLSDQPGLGPHDIIGAGGHSLGCIGRVMLLIEYFGHKAIIEASVCRNLVGSKQLYIGWKEMIDIGIIPPEYPAPLDLSSAKPVQRPTTTLDSQNRRIQITPEVKRAWNIQVGDAMERWDRMRSRPGNGASMADHFWIVNQGIPGMDLMDQPEQPPGAQADANAVEIVHEQLQDNSVIEIPDQPPILDAPDVQVVTPEPEIQAVGNDPVQVPIENAPEAMSSTSQESVIELSEMKVHVRDSVKQLMGQYDDVFDIKNLKSLKGPKMRIVLRDDIPIVPNYVNGSRATPYSLIEEANKELKSYLDSKIITKISPGERTRWLNAAMFLPKPNGGVRLVVDLRILNAMAKREVHCFQSPMDILKSIPPGNKFFAVIDAYRGYYQCDLHPDDQDLTAFVLKDFGTFKFTKIPQGYKSSGDHFCKLSDLVIRDVPKCRKLVDDILLFAETENELLENLKILFESCRKFNLTLNPNKTQIGKQVTFGGYVLNGHGIKIDPKRVKAIREFEIPETITDVRSFMGLCMQFKHHTPELMKNLLPIIALTSTKSTPVDPSSKDISNEISKKSSKTKTKIVWNENLNQAFNNIKKLLTSIDGKIMCHFDASKPFYVYTDASRDGGLGWCGVQFQDGLMRIVECGSCTISETARRAYSVSELELLGVVTALKKLRMYTVGNRQLVVRTDHLPLVGMMNKSIDKLETTRLCRMVEKISAYNFTIEHVPGKKNDIADALSRHPVDSHDEFATEFETFNVHSISETENATMEGLKLASKSSETYQQIINYHQSGKKIFDCPPDHPAKQYKNI